MTMNEAASTKPTSIEDNALDEISGGPIEIRELHIRTSVDEGETEGSRDLTIKTKKIFLPG